MNLPNPDLLKSFRRRGKCECCGKMCDLCGAHVFSKGAGQIDHMVNLVALGMDTIRDCDCHHRSHQGLRPTTYDLLALVGKREGLHPELIKDVVDAIRAVPAKLSLEQIEQWVDGYVQGKRVSDLSFAIIVDWFREFRNDEYMRWVMSSATFGYESRLHRNS